MPNIVIPMRMDNIFASKDFLLMFNDISVQFFSSIFFLYTKLYRNDRMYILLLKEDKAKGFLLQFHTEVVDMVTIEYSERYINYS